MDNDVQWKGSARFCVCFADIVDSTLLTLRISQSNGVREFYSTYINTLSSVVKSFNSVVLKNTGDGLIYYFPATSDPSNKQAFRDVLLCASAALAARPELNKILGGQRLPELNYRISCDYGKHEVGEFSSTQSTDFVSSTMNICSKINSMAEPNGIVIGGDLYQIFRSLSINGFEFHSKGAYPLGFSREYPVYSVVSKPKASASKESHSTPASDLRQLERKPESPIKRLVHKRAKVMVVDDEPDVLLTFKEFLQLEQFDVETFGKPESALQRFAECADGNNYFDLAILDIKMPNVNGLQLYERLRRIDSNIKTIFISGLDAGRELVNVIPDVGGRMLIKKPVSREPFTHQVKSILSESHMG